MLDESMRKVILELRKKGRAKRAIARALGISRGAVLEVLKSGMAEVPHLERPEKAEAYRDDILRLLKSCKGNLVRVHEELIELGAEVSYPGLTAFCRRHGIGHEPPPPAGQYEFAPGQEMQHDTSPQDASIGGSLRRIQTASLVLCNSRMTFIQLYPFFTRFICKIFLTDGLQYFGGSAKECMVDNTNVVRLHGTGKDMVPVPEMEAFAKRFRFTFKAHEIGDANRSARVEGPFDYTENNFLAGREFSDFDDANHQAIVWCDKINAKFSSKLHASRRELFAAEAPHLRSLPEWVPEVYDLHNRIVDLEGYISVHSARYSAPYTLIGRSLEIRETKDRIDMSEGPRQVASHHRPLGFKGKLTLPEHRPPRGTLAKTQGPSAEERELLAAAPELEGYIDALKHRGHGHGTLPMRRLLRMLRDYPRASFLEAVRDAAHYGLYDLDRLERMVLRNIRRDFFPNVGPDPCDP